MQRKANSKQNFFLSGEMVFYFVEIASLNIENPFPVS
jgi:hypothetical protein